MAKKSKNTAAAKRQYDKSSMYSPEDAVALVRSMAFAKFDESVDAVFNLGIDALVRLERILLLEAYAVSRGVQTRSNEVGGPLKDRLDYQFSWQVSVALRLPPPFTWGVLHRGILNAPIRADYSLGRSDYLGYWGFFVEYVF